MKGTVDYLFGRERDAEYLDYDATHGTTGDRHVRIHCDGHCGTLDAPMYLKRYPICAGETKMRHSAEEFYAYNRVVYKTLGEKGFCSKERKSCPCKARKPAFARQGSVV